MVESISSVGAELPGIQAAGSGSALTSDFETFLKMLTAQAMYQDPLEPIDSSEYAAQLAQFSMVEQQVQTNGFLEALVNGNGTQHLAAMSGWVGREIRGGMPASFDGEPVLIYPNPAAVSDSVDLVVRDETGTEVQRKPLPVAAEPYSWDGSDSSGVTVGEGLYSFTVESLKDGEVILAEPAETYASVSEVQMLNGEVILILASGQAILASSATAIRDPV